MTAPKTQQTGGNDICVATGMAVRCRRDARCRQCTGKRLSRAIWSSFNKERMSHLCDSTVASPTARRDNVLASKCEYPPFRYPPFIQNLSRRLFFGVPIRGAQICKKFVENLKNGNFRTNFQIFDTFLTNLGPPDWSPEKQSSGQILDKFGFRGVFECCKGKKGSQPK